MKLLKSEQNLKNQPILIGVTGTYGKTVVTHLLAHIFNFSEKKAGYISSLGYFDGKTEGTDMNANNLSRNSLNGLINEMAENKCDFGIIEITSRNIQKGLYKGLELSNGIITNIIGHFDGYRTWDEYASTKLEFIKMIANKGLLVLNGDDKDVISWLKSNTAKLPQNIYCYWTSKRNILNESTSLSGLIFDLGNFMKVYSPMIGHFNKMNIYQAAKVASRYLPPNAIYNALSNFKGPKGRFEQVYYKPYSIFIDSAYAPIMMRDALGFLNANKPTFSKVISVIGSPGNRSKDFRKIGEEAAKYSDLIVLASNDPYFEKVANINNELIEHATRAGGTLIERFSTSNDFKMTDLNSLLTRVEYARKNGEVPIIAFDADNFTSRLDAIKFGIKAAKLGDLIYIGGKGSDTSARYGDVEYEWSDYEAVKQILNEALKH